MGACLQRLLNFDHPTAVLVGNQLAIDLSRSCLSACCLSSSSSPQACGHLTMTRVLNSKPKPGWQKLVAPMLLASLGLHGLLLLLPVSSEEDALPPPDFEQDNIAITRVPPAAPAAANPPLASTPTALSPAARVAQPASPAASRQPSAAPARRASAQTARRQTASNPAQSTAASAGQVVGPPPDPAGLSAPLSPQPRPFDSALYEKLLAYAQALQLPQGQIAQLASTLSQRYAYSAANTTGEAVNANLKRWVDQVKQSTGQPDLWNEVLEPPLTLTHRRRVCLTPPPQAVQAGILVTPSGQPEAEPVLLQSSGYAFLDAVALAQVKQQNFPSTEGYRAYTVDVNVAVDYGSLDCLKPYARP